MTTGLPRPTPDAKRPAPIGPMEIPHDAQDDLEGRGSLGTLPSALLPQHRPVAALQRRSIRGVA